MEKGGKMKKIILFIIISVLSFSSYYKIENNKVYFEDILIKNADIKTFDILNNFLYAKYKNNVYYLGYILEEADAGTFEVLHNAYAKDKNNVYFYSISITSNPIGIIKKSADSNTFITYEEDKTINGIFYNAEDKNNYYSEGAIVKEKEF